MCYRTDKFTVCRRVHASFSLEILQSGAMKGLMKYFRMSVPVCLPALDLSGLSSVLFLPMSATSTFTKLLNSDWLAAVQICLYLYIFLYNYIYLSIYLSIYLYIYTLLLHECGNFKSQEEKWHLWSHTVAQIHSFIHCCYVKVAVSHHWRKSPTCDHQPLFKLACLYSVISYLFVV